MHTFYKGDIVTPNPLWDDDRICGYRQMSAQEVDAWYKTKQAQSPHDDAGEPWVCSGIRSTVLTPGHTYEVLKGAARIRTGWSATGGGCIIKCTTTGAEYQVLRKKLRRVT